MNYKAKVGDWIIVKDIEYIPISTGYYPNEPDLPSIKECDSEIKLGMLGKIIGIEGREFTIRFTDLLDINKILFRKEFRIVRKLDIVFRELI